MKKLHWLFGFCLMIMVLCCGNTSVCAGETDDFSYFENDDGTICITGYTGSDETVTIPSELDGKMVKRVGGIVKINPELNRRTNTFDTIKYLTVSEGIIELERCAFSCCESIETVSLPNSITEINEEAFSGCDKLESILLPKQLTGIKYAAFLSCSALTSINIPESVNVIDSEAFNTCKSLVNINIPQNVKIISEAVFGGCESLEKINIPEGVTEIKDDAFYKCLSLEKINIPEGVTRIGNFAFSGCIALKKLEIPDSVVEIGNDALKLDDGECITIYANPNSYAKKYADKMKNIKFICIKHSNIITDAKIPATCSKEGRTAGKRCIDCGTIISGYDKIPITHQIVRFYEPPTCINVGIEYTYCKICNQIYINENGKINKPKTLKRTSHKFDNGVVIVAPSVIKTGLKLYTCKVCGGNKTEIIPKIAGAKTGTSITDSDNSYNIIQSDINNGAVEYIGTTSKKDTIVIPDTVKIDGVDYKVTSIGKNAFKNNKKLKKITIGSNITKINAGAFNGCKNLKTITIKTKNLKSIGKNAFKGIKVNAKIKVPSSKLKKYQKLCKNKGQKSTVKITK